MFLLFLPAITDTRKPLKIGVLRCFFRVLIFLYVEFHLPLSPREYSR